MRYYVIKKNVNGEYLLSDKNEIIMQSYVNKNACWITFIDEVLNRKSKSDKFVLCEKPDNSKKYIHILCEQ